MIQTSTYVVELYGIFDLKSYSVKFLFEYSSSNRISDNSDSSTVKPH